MATPLESALSDLGVSDAEFGEACGLLRGHIHAIKTRRKMPRADTAAKILAELKKRGVEMTLDQLIGRRSRKAA